MKRLMPVVLAGLVLTGCVTTNPLTIVGPIDLNGRTFSYVGSRKDVESQAIANHHVIWDIIGSDNKPTGDLYTEGRYGMHFQEFMTNIKFQDGNWNNGFTAKLAEGYSALKRKW